MNNNDVVEKSPVLYSMAFFDVQNLFRHAKDAFQSSAGIGYHHPNFDPVKLHKKVAEAHGFKPTLTRFYTGVPLQTESEMWHGYWNNRIRSLKRAGVMVESRSLKYHQEELPDGTTINVGQEKGIDIRIALDLVRCTRKKEFDAVIIFSQDQDLAEAVQEVKDIAKDQGRFVQIISAYPESSLATSGRGIDKANWFKFNKDLYDQCLDPQDYRPAKFQPQKVTVI